MSLSISGAVSSAALYVDAPDAQHIVRVDAHTVIVPATTDALTVGVEPVGAATFGHNTLVYLAIGPDSPGEVDPVQVGFDPVNVSGSGATELAALTPHGGRVEVAVRAVADVPLSPLASMARTAARRIAGSRQPPTGGALCVGVDTSASMRWAFDEGSVGAAIDMIVGVADVVGIRDVGVILVGERGQPVRAPVAELAAAVAATPVAWSAGARWSRLPEAERALLVTDSVNPIPRENVPTMRISRDERLGATGPLLCPPPDGMRAEHHLTANPALVDQVAAALLDVLA